MTPVRPDALRRELGAAGIPGDFSVVCVHQIVPRAVVREIDALIEVFERVTTRPSWQRAACADGPEWVRELRGEACFFSAWDLHLPLDGPWRLIELNDNGSGFMFAAILNDVYYRLAGLTADKTVETPRGYTDLCDYVVACIEREMRELFDGPRDGICFILDDADSLAHGHFRVEHDLLAAALRMRGREVAIGTPDQLSIMGRGIHHDGRDVSCVVNRSTDFLWMGEAFVPIRRAFTERSVYVAPNPFTYLTRSDKRLLELLSLPDRDAELGIERDERAVLGLRVPETRLLRDTNLDELARRKHELFFKPARGYASRGVIAGGEVGRSRLRRLLRDGEPYVAQRFVPKGRVEGPEGAVFQTDLRVWAYRGKRYLMSGRATRGEHQRDLRSGGWIPTFVGEALDSP